LLRIIERTNGALLLFARAATVVEPRRWTLDADEDEAPAGAGRRLLPLLHA
jgi:hypothetical protein